MRLAAGFKGRDKMATRGAIRRWRAILCVSELQHTIIKGFGFLLLAAGVALSGCGAKKSPDVMDLMLPIGGLSEFGVSKIQHKSVLLADSRGVGAQTEQAMQPLREHGISSSAYFKYWIDDVQSYKVRINTYSSIAEREKSWVKRYPPETLAATRDLGLGAASFMKAQMLGAFAIDKSLVEVASSKGAPRLEEFARAYAAFVASNY